jgi:hypothetical protein
MNIEHFGKTVRGKTKVLSGKFVSLPINPSHTHIDWPGIEPTAFIIRGP